MYIHLFFPGSAPAQRPNNRQHGHPVASAGGKSGRNVCVCRVALPVSVPNALAACVYGVCQLDMWDTSTLCVHWR